MQLIFTLRKWNMRQRNALYFYCSYACTLVSCKPISLSDVRHEMGTAINEVRKQTAVFDPLPIHLSALSPCFDLSQETQDVVHCIVIVKHKLNEM